MHIDVADVVGSLGDGDTITVGSVKLTLTVLRALRSTEAEPHTSPRVKDQSVGFSKAANRQSKLSVAQAGCPNKWRVLNCKWAGSLKMGL